MECDDEADTVKVNSMFGENVTWPILENQQNVSFNHKHPSRGIKPTSPVIYISILSARCITCTEWRKKKACFSNNCNFVYL
jgi:hypothetical protein